MARALRIRRVWNLAIGTAGGGTLESRQSFQTSMQNFDDRLALNLKRT